MQSSHSGTLICYIAQELEIQVRTPEQTFLKWGNLNLSLGYALKCTTYLYTIMIDKQGMWYPRAQGSQKNPYWILLIPINSVFASYSLLCRSHIVLSWCIVLGWTCYICTRHYHSTQRTLPSKKGSEGKPKFNEYIVP